MHPETRNWLAELKNEMVILEFYQSHVLEHQFGFFTGRTTETQIEFQVLRGPLLSIPRDEITAIGPFHYTHFPAE